MASIFYGPGTDLRALHALSDSILITMLKGKHDYDHHPYFTDGEIEAEKSEKFVQIHTAKK